MSGFPLLIDLTHLFTYSNCEAVNSYLSSFSYASFLGKKKKFEDLHIKHGFKGLLMTFFTLIGILDGKSKQGT